jgi:N-acetylmuramoyl-L-alanine amidase
MLLKVRHKIRLPMLALASILLMTFGTAPAALSKNPVLKLHENTIVLDPGHGGNDTGTQSSDDIQEKAVTLNMAQMIAGKLGNVYKVVLTRTDDYLLDIPGRTAVANHQQADLFISLHAGGSFQRSVGGTSVYYYEMASDSSPADGSSGLDSLNGTDSPILWDHIQEKYLTSSKKLAKIVQAQIFKITRDPDSKIKGAPLVVLKGADMPAILIELGYLTNPSDSKALIDPDYLALLAEAISKGIRQYLSEKGK